MQSKMKFTQRLNCVIAVAKPYTRENRGPFVTALDHVFPKAYNPPAIEKNVYEFWESNGYFTSTSAKNERFSMVLPPPNVTGTLHLGHAITVAVQDTLVRWRRMQGMDVLWIPGLDHAGIATQTVVERWLKENENLTRHDLGREKFVDKVVEWKNKKGDVIDRQMRRLGASLDWSRQIFTMDSRHSSAVVEAIIRLWNAGLIYRKESLINWSCQLSSAISDIEVDRVDISGPTPISVPGYDKPVMFGELTDIAYKVCGSEEELVVSTTRPETMLGDVAVAVHPQDTRFSHLHKAKLWHPFRKIQIPVICDEMVDMKFGTGAVKITPGHNHTDWEVAKRHGLPLLSVIDEKGYISTDQGEHLFNGLKRFEARDKIRGELERLGLLKSVRPHGMQLPVCSRSGDIVEHLLKDQWFISCKDMAARASMAVKEGQLEVEPARFQNTWYHWLDNTKDWCISRQLWWGHRLPLYQATRGASSLWVAAPSLSHATTQAASQLGGPPDSISQDPDVLDTWFSSALYPLSALGWPHQTDDLKRYHPLDILETGHDILFFWVARMVMLGQQLTGQLPFKKILLHGIICDAQGRKMSKSLGNVVNPEDVINGISLKDLTQQVVDSHKAGLLSAKEMQLAIKGQQKLFPKGIPPCGIDAVRFTLLSHNTKSDYISFDVRECETNYRFCNKIWQASRFALYWADELRVQKCSPPQYPPPLMSRWILSQLDHTVERVTNALQSADLHLATGALKDFLYNKFCDVYVETTKPVLKEGSEAEVVATVNSLLYCLDVSLRLLAPIMPFISEQLFKHLPGCMGQSVMLTAFPSTLQEWRNPELDETVQLGLEVLSVIRSMKNVNGFHKKNIPVELGTIKEQQLDTMREMLELLGQCTLVITEADPASFEPRQHTISQRVADHTLVHINLQNMSEEQYDQYMTNLKKKETELLKDMNHLIKKTQQPHYMSKVDGETQLDHTQQIKVFEEEIRAVRQLMELNKLE